MPEASTTYASRTGARSAGRGPGTAPAVVHRVLAEPGRPLDHGTRMALEPRFGHDFSQVRIHADAGAATSAAAVGAHAYTVGQHIAFGTGRYRPNTSEGRALLAHELAHTVQQRTSASTAREALVVGPVDDPAERDADLAASNATSARAVHGGTGEPFAIDLAARPASVARQQAPAGNAPAVNSAPATLPTGMQPGGACPDYEPGERTKSHTEDGLLAKDVERLGPDQLLIADFGVGSATIKQAARSDPDLRAWTAQFAADTSYQVSVVGYSDCRADDTTNIDIRQRRAATVAGLLDPRTRAVSSVAMAGLGQFVAGNSTATDRARNRSAVIRFYQQFDFPEETVQGQLRSLPAIDVRSFSPSPGIVIDRTGTSITIDAKLEAYGADADAAKASAAETAIRTTWNQKFPDGFEVACTVSVTYRPPGVNPTPGTGQVEMMQIVTPSYTTASSGYIQLNTGDADALTYVIAHEFGHLLGLKDRYIESIRSRAAGLLVNAKYRSATTEPGYEGNLMAESGGALESKNISDIAAENQPGLFDDDDQVRLWVKRNPGAITALTAATKIQMIKTLLGGIVSTDDADTIVGICAATPDPVQLADIRRAVEPLTVNIGDFGLRIRVRAALAGTGQPVP